MFISTTLVLLSTTPLILARPTPLLPRVAPSFPAGSSWDIVLNSGSIGDIKKVVNPKTFATIDIDLFDTSPADIAALSAGKKVICYFSAGSYEDWRADKGLFVEGDMGKELDGWPGERWLNVKSANVKSIMKKRIAKAKAAGCTAVDPDNVDGFVSISLLLLFHFHVPENRQGTVLCGG
ncbi:glycoside hydrolase family 114 protein [Amniculicola lignicola CBS 123094]|uniref:alpha-galactosidase n=1 Tax=Amniculicola lignicola CBS 123094 TaxID=1392246 RepID=A0A6A5WIQ9_9PLEO|nr:glycoside hydrolase family 114 protein [Amniculicola lignicola CBS 123094]